MEQALSHVREREFADTTNIEQVLEWRRSGFPFSPGPTGVRPSQTHGGHHPNLPRQAPNPSVRKSFELMMYSFMEFVGGQKVVAISCIREAIALFSAQELRQFALSLHL